MNASNLQLQRPTNRTSGGPKFHNDGQRIIVQYDYEEDNGKSRMVRNILWRCVGLRVSASSLLRPGRYCRGARSSLPGTIRASVGCGGSVAEIGWLAGVATKTGRRMRFKHFTLFFDDAGCVNVVAASCVLD